MPNYKAKGTVVFQNKTPMCQYRAVGHPIAVAITEALVDKAASECNIDRFEFRKNNLIPDNAYPTKTPSGVPLEDLSHHACIEKLKKLMNIDELERYKKYTIDVMVDRLKIKTENKERLSESIESCFRLGNCVFFISF